MTRDFVNGVGVGGGGGENMQHITSTSPPLDYRITSPSSSLQLGEHAHSLYATCLSLSVINGSK